MNYNHKKKNKAKNSEENSNKARLSPKGITIDFLRKNIEENLPYLARELNNPKLGSFISLNKNRNLIKKNNKDQYKPPESPDFFDSSGGKTVLDQRKERLDSIKKRFTSKYNKDSELFYPKTVDFLRRCSNLEEAEEIIKFQLKMKEITKKEAEDLMIFCRRHGLQYFGNKKNTGYYEKRYRRSNF